MTKQTSTKPDDFKEAKNEVARKMKFMIDYANRIEPTGKKVEIDGVHYRVYNRFWTDVDLRDLDDGDLVRYGDGETYHELLTPIQGVN